jgi:hypothetical protein
MFGEYAALAKWALIIGTLSAIVYSVENFGYNRAWDKHLSIEKTRIEEVNKIKQIEHDKFIQESTKSGAYADFINGEYNAKVDQIKQLKSYILDLNSNVSRMRQRSACGHSENRVPTNNDTSVHAETTSDDDSGFSNEFKQFLESQAKRDEYAVNWINSTIEATKKLCDQPNVKCEK